MSKRKIALALGIIAAVIGWNLYRRSQVKPVESRAPTYEDTLAQDRVTLADDKKAAPLQIYNSLLRLAQANDPLALTKAQELANSSQEWIRAGCAAAFSYSNDPSAPGRLQSYLSDKSEVVRRSAIEALGFNRSPAKKQMLQKFLLSKDLRPLERADALATMIVYLNPQKDKNEISRDTYDILILAGQLKNKNDLLECFSLIDSLPGQNKNPMVESYMERVLQQSTNEDLRSFAVRHLAAFSPEDFRKIIGSYVMDHQDEVRLAVAQNVAYVCPKDRYNILRRILENEKDLRIWNAAGQSLMSFPTIAAKEIVQNLKGMPLSQEKKNQVDVMVVRMEKKGSLQDPCVRRYPDDFKAEAH